MAKNPVLPLYYNDIKSSTEHWSDEEFGAYMRLLIHQWDKGSIPADNERLKRISSTARKHWNLLKEKFVKQSDGLLKNERMEEIRSDRETHQKRQAENARKRYQNANKPPAKLPAKPVVEQLPLEVEEEREEDLGKSENPLGMEAVKVVANDAWKDQAWREGICMAAGVTERELKLWMAQFNVSVSNDVLNDFTVSRYKKMFRGFLNSELRKGVTVGRNGSDAPELPTRHLKLNS